jgi:glutaredoxin
MASQPSEIIMYARERFCPDVTRTRLRLTDLGLEWTEFDVEADPAAKEAAFKASGRGSVPTIVIGERVLVEPSNAELDEALITAGYELSED